MTTDRQIREKMASIYGNWVRHEEVTQDVQINEIPVMWSIDGKLVCLKTTRDEHTIGVVGTSGSGKSFFLNSLLGRLYWYGKKRVFIGNDYQNETFAWSKPNQSQDQITQLSILGEKPMGLPIVYLAPNTKAFKEPPVDYVKIALPLNEILMNCEYYMDLGRSSPYFKGVVPNLLGKSFPEICDELENAAIPWQTKNKLQAALNNLWEERIVEGIDENSVSKVSVLYKQGDSIKRFAYNILLGLLYANLIPSFLTGDLLTKSYYDIYMRYFFDCIMEAQKFDPYFSKREISTYALIDELTLFASSERRTRPATQSIRQYAARGRFNRLGMIYATQNYSKIEHIVRTNTRYLFVLHYNNATETNAIAGDFSLSNYEKEAIGKLPKFHMLAMAQGEKFVTYDPDGTRLDNVGGVMEGIALPPLSHHQAPKEVS